MKKIFITMCILLTGCATTSREQVWLDNQRKEIDEAYETGKISKEQQISLKMEALKVAQSGYYERKNIWATSMQSLNTSNQYSNNHQQHNISMRDANGNWIYGTMN